MSEIVPVYTSGETLAPYTPAIKVNGFVYCSGQIGFVDGKLSGDFATEARAALNRVKNLLEEAGTNLSKVIKVTVFLSQTMENFELLTKVYSEFFVKPYPARSCVAVAALPRGALVEIEVIALDISK